MFQRICPECGRAIDRQEGECSFCELEPEFAPLLPLPAFQARTLASPTPLSCEGPSFPDSSPILPESEIVKTLEPKLAGPSNYSALTLARMQPVTFKRPSNAEISPTQMAPLSPAIPQDLSSLQSPAAAKAITPPPSPQPHTRQTSWVLSLAIGAGIVAVTLGGAFYAIPTLAGTGKAAPVVAGDKLPPAVTPAVEVVAPPTAPEKPEHPLASAIEVTGIRFITDVPNQHPQVHYLVVNHSANPVADATATVTLSAKEGSASLSQFSFRVPRLGAYESKEMVNAIEQLNRPVAALDWRHINVHVALEK